MTARPPFLIVAGVFLLALAVRVVFVLQWNDTPYGAVPLLDARMYDGWAQSIADGHFMRDKAFYQSPLYPYVLALIYKIFGHDLLAAALANAALGAGACAILALTAFTYFGPGAAIATGLLAAFSKPFVFYAAPVMKEPLGLFLLALFVLLALRALRENRAAGFFRNGLVLGLCALVRGNALLLAPIMLALVFIGRKPSRLKNGAIFAAAALLAILPATLHNAIASRDFILINYTDGFNLYIGNSPTADGTSYSFPPGLASDPGREELDVTWAASRAGGRDLSPSEVSKYWRGQALDFIRQHPGRSLQLLGNKIVAVWSSSQPFDNYDIAFIEDNFGTILPWLLPGFAPLALLAPFAAAALWRRKREAVLPLTGFAAAYIASVLLFYVTDRYRLPLFVFLLPLAGAALPEAWRLIRSKSYKPLALATVAALAAFGFSLWPAERQNIAAYDWGMLASINTELGRNEEAVTAMHKAFAISPLGAGAEAFVKGALAEERLGRYGESEKLLRMALEIFPADGSVTYNYGRFKAATGDLKGAMAAFEKTVELTPTYLLGYYGQAAIYKHWGDRRRAIEAVRRGLKFDPSDPYLVKALADLQAAGE